MANMITRNVSHVYVYEGEFIPYDFARWLNSFGSRSNWKPWFKEDLPDGSIRVHFHMEIEVDARRERSNSDPQEKQESLTNNEVKDS